MNPVLLAPAGLAALVALALPLLIHLARREENRPLDFAALRWLSPRPRPRSRIRFDERLLLAVRLLLVTLLALWLAQPALTGNGGHGSRVLVVPGVASPNVTAGTDARWLAPGFPPVDRPAPTGPQPIASLLRQADAETPRGIHLTVVTPSVLDGVDAQRPRLFRRVTWQVGQGISPPASVARVTPPRLAIRYDPARPTGLRYFAAVARAWQPDVRTDIAPATDALPPAGTLLAWLSPGTLPEPVNHWVVGGGTILVTSSAILPAAPAVATLWRDELGAPLMEQQPVGRGRILRFTRSLAPASMPELVNPEFPRHLRELLATSPAPARVRAADYTPLGGGRRYPLPAQPLAPWLGVGIAGLFLLERWLASRRTRASAP